MLKRNKLKFLWLYKAKKKAGKGKNMFLISGFASPGATIGLSNRLPRALALTKLNLKIKLKGCTCSFFLQLIKFSGLLEYIYLTKGSLKAKHNLEKREKDWLVILHTLL